MKNKFFAPLLAIGLLFSPVLHTAHAQMSGPLPSTAEKLAPNLQQWYTDSRYGFQLQVPQTVGYIQMQLPLHYTGGYKTARYDLPEYSFDGPTEASGLQAGVDVFLYPMSQPPSDFNSVLAFFAVMIKVAKHHVTGLSNVTSTEPIYGNVNGMITAKFYLKGRQHVSHGTHELHAIIYMFRSLQGYTFVVGSDYEPSSHKTLPLIEASILTAQEPQVQPNYGNSPQQ